MLSFSQLFFELRDPLHLIPQGKSNKTCEQADQKQHFPASCKFGDRIQDGSGTRLSNHNEDHGQEEKDHSEDA